MKKQFHDHRKLYKIERWIANGFVLIWTIVLLGIFVVKISTDDFGDFSDHYTNWNWTLSTVFFTIDSITVIMELFGSRLHAYYGRLLINTTFFWLVNASAWLVFWLMFIVLEDNPNIFINLSTQGGGKYYLGFVYDLDRVLHILPAICILLYYIFRRKSITRAVSLIYFKKNLILIKFAYVLYILVLSAIPLGIYDLAFNFQVIYKITTNLAIVYVSAIVITIVSNGVPFLITLVYKRHFKKPNTGAT